MSNHENHTGKVKFDSVSHGKEKYSVLKNSVSEGREKYTPFSCNLCWIFALVIGFPDEGKGGHHRLIRRLALEKLFFFFFQQITFFWKAKNLSKFQDAFKDFDTDGDIPDFYLCNVLCFSHDQRQIHMYR